MKGNPHRRPQNPWNREASTHAHAARTDAQSCGCAAPSSSCWYKTDGAGKCLAPGRGRAKGATTLAGPVVWTLLSREPVTIRGVA